MSSMLFKTRRGFIECTREFYAMTSGGAHGIRTKNIFSDLKVEVTILPADPAFVDAVELAD